MAARPPASVSPDSAQERWHRAWYQGRRWVYWLLPLTGLFRLVSAARRLWLTRWRQQQLPVPVIVVGNISVGGTGKTPLIIALAEHLRSRGYRPGIVSRGHGGKAPAYPLDVTLATPVEYSGDEPLAIARATGCPVSVGPDRVAAARRLHRQHHCDVILSDDGLQHYRLGRALEIAVIDAQRGFGNGFCLPVGPLREPVARLKTVDWVVLNGEIAKPPSLPAGVTATAMTVVPSHWCPVAGGEAQPLDHFTPGQTVDAVAGIGNPARFFTTLEQLQLSPRRHPFADHHSYRPQDLAFGSNRPLVMTAKDAVKCQAFAQSHWWFLAVSARLPESFWQALDRRLNAWGPATDGRADNDTPNEGIE